jgi:release factor glutamine methyltransferase
LPAIRQLLSGDAAKLAAALALDVTDARFEVQYLLQHVLKKPRAWLLAHPEHVPSAAELVIYERLLQRRLQGEPIAYILGEREFFGLNFRVTPATLIPRPETELLVELALQHIPLQQPKRVLDLGTGSGAVALAIAHARPGSAVTATDASPTALVIAQENAQLLDIGNVHFLNSNWFDGLAELQRFDLIVSNPPYVATDDPHLRKGDLPFEPISALASGADGLEDIRRIVSQAPDHLQPGGWLLLEHGYDQASAVRELLLRTGLVEAFSVPDLSGIERISGGRLA